MPNEALPPALFAQLISAQIAKGGVRSVHIATEPGHPSRDARLSILDTPRFSLCLRGTGRYYIRHADDVTVVTLHAGDVLFIPAHCGMEPVPGSDYLALGVLSHTHFTRLLLAEASSSPVPCHRFRATHHCPHPLDRGGRHIMDALLQGNVAGVQTRLLEILLLQIHQSLGLPQGTPSDSKARFTLQAACQFVQEHLQHPIGRKDVANFLHLHPNHISRVFTQTPSQSFTAYLREQRLKRAQILLSSVSLNISEIARACGFNSASGFARNYRREFGHPPTENRAELIRLHLAQEPDSITSGTLDKAIE